MVETPANTLGFIKRLLKPIEIAQSMQQVDPAFLKESNDAKIWYHGDQESDLYVWKDPDGEALKAWQLSVGTQYVEWSELTGLKTGSLSSSSVTSALLIPHPASQLQNADAIIDTKKQQLAIDIIMALPDPVKDLILETFGE